LVDLAVVTVGDDDLVSGLAGAQAVGDDRARCTSADNDDPSRHTASLA